MGVAANSPLGRVVSAEKSYASGSLSYKEYQRIAREEGYNPAKAADVKAKHGNKRKPKK